MPLCAEKTSIKQVCLQLTPKAYYIVNQLLFLQCSFVKTNTGTPSCDCKIHRSLCSVYFKTVLTTNNFSVN